MRFLVVAALTATACIEYDATQFQVQSIAEYSQFNGMPPSTGTPLLVCDLPHPAVMVVGSGFVPDVQDATGDNPKIVYPTVELVGPATITGTSDSGSSPTALQVSFPRVAPNGQRWPYGAYSVRVTDFDGRSVELADTVALSGGPAIDSATPPSTCVSSSQTVVLRGGPFLGPIKAVIPFGADLKQIGAQLVASDEIDVSVPAYPVGFAASGYDIWIYDGAACPSAIHMTESCP